MENVYCKNCKWYREEDEDPLGIAGGSYIHFYCKKYNKSLNEIEPSPTENKCYQRKWWKFWVK